jgi:hypothetical protein
MTQSEYREMKLTIYENNMNGSLSDEDRDRLLGVLESKTPDVYLESWIPSMTLEECVQCEMSECEVMMEGYNWDKRGEYRNTMREIKKQVKSAKKAMNAKNYMEAQSQMTQAISNLQTFKSEFIQSCNGEQSAVNAVIGFFAYGFRHFGLVLLTFLPTLGLSAIALQVKEICEFFVDIAQALKKFVKDEPMSPSDFNMYTKSMEHNMDLMISNYRSVLAKMKQKAKEQPKTEAN